MIDYHAAENEQRAKQTYRGGRTNRSASDASATAGSFRSPNSFTNNPNTNNSNNSILRRHSDTRYTAMSSTSSLSSLSSLSTHYSHHHHHHPYSPLNHHSHHHHPYSTTNNNTTLSTTPHLSHQLPTPDYYYYYNNNNNYKTPTNTTSPTTSNLMRDYANVQHHSSCHLYNGNEIQHPYSTNTSNTTTTNTTTSSSTNSSSSTTNNNNDRTLSPTPSNLFPPELSVTLSSVTSPHSSLSDDHLGSPLPQHFTMDNNNHCSDDDNKPRKRSKCEQKPIFETDSSNIHWPTLA